MSLEGKIASQGKAEAKALVTNNPLEKPPFEEYILVTQNSDPEISPLLYNAKGIITEVGGLMSHLAVVSREIKIPCITACEGSYTELKTGYNLKINAEDKLNSKVGINYDI
jgi:pyruvate,water dikinase